MAGPKAKYDPLEAAKVTEKTKADDDARLETGRATVPKPAAPAAPPAPEREPGPGPEMYEVLEPKLVSLGGGNMHRFKAGDRLDPIGYGGEEGLAKLGLKLKRVE